MLLTLLAKDLRRIRRNPGPWIAMLLIPIFLTSVIGFTFGGGGGNGPPGKIRVAVVDEDESVLSNFLRNAGRNDQAGEQLDIQLLSRDEATARVTDGAVAAVMILPKGFTDAFLAGQATPPIEVIKNPAQGFPPALVEEGVSAMVTLLNVFARTARPVLEELRPMLTEGTDFLSATALVAGTASRYEPARGYLFPWIFDVKTVSKEDLEQKAEDRDFNLFGYLLIGMGAMFVLYLADIAMRGLYQEVQIRTLERFRTLHGGLMTFITGKVIFAVAAAVLGAGIIYGSGPVLFQFWWRQPLALLALVLAYAVFAAGFMGLLSAFGGQDRRANVVNNVIITVVSIGGGAMMPTQNFGKFYESFIVPLMPTAWFVGAGRGLEFGSGAADWLPQCAKLIALGVVAIIAAAAIFRRRLEKGARG